MKIANYLLDRIRQESSTSKDCEVCCSTVRNGQTTRHNRAHHAVPRSVVQSCDLSPSPPARAPGTVASILLMLSDVNDTVRMRALFF